MKDENSFGYSDPRDIEWAKTCAKGKSGLPYGTSPSSQARWDKYNSDRDAKDLKNFGWFFVFTGFIFIFGMPFLGGK
jgi:hypothetical protein